MTSVTTGYLRVSLIGDDYHPNEILCVDAAGNRPRSSGTMGLRYYIATAKDPKTQITRKPENGWNSRRGENVDDFWPGEIDANMVNLWLQKIVAGLMMMMMMTSRTMRTTFSTTTRMI